MYLEVNCDNEKYYKSRLLIEIEEEIDCYKVTEIEEVHYFFVLKVLEVPAKSFCR